jgi:diacylglycerol kinase family enzyme
MPTPIPVVLNNASGPAKARADAAQVRAAFAAHGADAHLIEASGADLVAALQGAAAQRPPLLVVGGGDGSVSAAAAAVVDSPTTLGVLPLGTLNHFARDLGLPLDLPGAVRVALQGRPRPVDVGQVNDCIFINNTGLGLYPELVRRREAQQRLLGRGKWPSFAWALLAVLRQYPFVDVTIMVDGQAEHRRTPFVFVGNNEYRIQGLKVGARDRLDAGTLSLYLAPRAGRRALIRLALTALLNRSNPSREFEAMTATRIVIKTHRHEAHVSTDGEVRRMPMPLDIRVRPGALQVKVPDGDRG